MYSPWIITIFFAFLCRVALPANILMLHPIYCGSHEFVLRSLGDSLISRGHQVTQVRFKHNNVQTSLDNTNVTVITLDIVDHKRNCGRFVSNGGFDFKTVGAKILWNEGHSVLGLPFDIFCLTDAHCHTLFNSLEIEELLRSNKYDLAIVDLIANECGLAMAASLKVPIIGFWGFTFHNGEAAYSSSFSPPSLYPAFFSGFTRKMSLFERVQNFALHVFHRVYMDYQAYTAHGYIRAKYPEVDSTDKLIHDLELIFLNTNEFVDYPRLYAPNVIQVGGLQLREPKALPKEFLDFINGAENGIILFSLGYTGFSAKDIPQAIVENLIKTFSKLKQRVIMRFDVSIVPEVPGNILIADWVPQQDILAHEKTVAFFSHCGVGSVLESVYHGVPVIAVGIFADQLDNAAILEDIGVAIRLHKSQLSDERVVHEALLAITADNSSYRNSAQRLSLMWRDQAVSPHDLAAHWIEALMKFQSLRHLRIEHNDLNILQYFSVDVILLISTFMLIVVGLLILLMTKCLKRYSKQKSE